MTTPAAACASIALFAAFATPIARAADAIESRPIVFAKGASAATIKDSIRGDQTIDYQLEARAGQRMNVSLRTSNGANYFNVLPPGSSDLAIFIGSSGGNEWSGQLGADGLYTVRVYLMRSAARRHESARYTLTVSKPGASSTAPLGKAPAEDAKVKGTPYHAIGQVPCFLASPSTKPRQSDFGVIRGVPGNAEVHLRSPGGAERVVTFIDGKAAVPKDSHLKVQPAKDGWSIEIDAGERYEIPEAVVFGG
jgi:hypothetical protein